MQRIGRVERFGYDVFIHPDAEEHISRMLLLATIRKKASEIQKDPANHPLSTSLIKVELLP